MKLKTLILSISIVLFSAFCVKGQSDVQLAQYYEVPSFYNPSAIGNTDYIRIRGGARLQWLGIENAPQSFVGVADMPFKLLEKRFAVGVEIAQESIGLYQTLNAGAQIAYKLRKWGGLWSVGLQVGLYDQSFKGSEVYLPDDDDYHQSVDDAIPTSDIHGTALDLAAGIWYEHPRFYAGLSCTHLTSPTITMNAENASGGSETSSDRKYQFQARRTLYFTAGCNIPIENTLFEIAPSVLVKSDFGFTTGELTARARYRKLLSFGVGYRWNDAVIATVAAEVKNFYIGYSYEYATTAIRAASSGSHELFIGYSLKLDLSDKNRNRHKSVRLM
ncbi:MAG: PorP/SprF family type IX secretion system membrane protein [Muribaculaceae bacterium]|nr:PorP/SprF family type IX secretion system membrane protein [Muribaculaceae bacterium]